MPVSTDDILQSASGSFIGTSGSATLPGGTQAGSPVILAVGLGGDNSGTFSVAPPSGFELASSPSTGPRFGIVYLFLKRSASASETSWTLTVTGGTQQVCWAVFEWPGIDVVDGVYLKTGLTNPFSTGTPVASRSTLETATSASLDSMGISIFFATNPGTTVPVLSGHSGNWQEIATATSTNATRSHALSIAALPSITLETFLDSISVAPDSYVYADLSVFTAVAAKHAPRFEAVSGFEFGTITSVTNGVSPGTAPFDGVVGSPAIVATSPRSGNWCLELSSSAAAECVTWTGRTAPLEGNLGYTGGTPELWVERFHFYFPTSLPGADVEIASVEAGSLANGVTIWYRSATQKIGVKVGTGTEVASDAVVAANKWIGIDYRYDPRTTAHTCDWQIDYDSQDVTGPVAQTQATGTLSAALVTTVRKGWTTSKTATVRYDDIAGGKIRKSYPIGDINIRPLKVDPAGTPTVSGTTANFQTFSSNGGTMTAFSAANVRAALDDIPPTIGAASDGLAQIATASNDYVEIPMETYTAAPDDVLRAVRWYVAVWAASATAATMGLFVGDSTGMIHGSTAADLQADNAALLWVSIMHQQQGTTAFNLLTQAKADSLVTRMGYSTDASPDVGIHCVLAELVTAPADVYIASESGEGHTVYVRQDPVTQAIASVTVVTPSGSGGTLYATIAGSDITPVYVPPADIYVMDVGASYVGEVSSLGFTVDPTA